MSTAITSFDLILFSLLGTQQGSIHCYAKHLAGKLNPDLKANLNGHQYVI